MKRSTRLFSVVLFAFASIVAAEDSPSRKTIGVDKVTVSKSLQTIVKRTGQDETLALLTDSMNQHFLTELEESNKFRVIAGGDLSKIIDQQQVPVGVIRDSDGKGSAGKIAGLDRLLITQITEMRDQIQARQGGGQRLITRSVQATAVIKIYDTTSGELIKSLDIPVHEEVNSRERVVEGVNDNGGEDHSLIEVTAVDLAKHAVSSVVETMYPAMVAAVQDGVVFINRGQGSGIDRDQVWEIFAQGVAFKDPATGMVLGQTESKVAEVVVTDVLPNFSKGKILGNNNGVDVGSVLRMKAPPPPSGPPNGGDPAMQH